MLTGPTKTRIEQYGKSRIAKKVNAGIAKSKSQQKVSFSTPEILTGELGILQFFGETLVRRFCLML